MKINPEYFIENEKNAYYPESADKFMIYPMVEMSGKDHVYFILEILYSSIYS